ncbi:uncharacterized protein SCDLUD_002840 [Saccharomycodes ludwigii]|uniref:uncharacterized protein n=1 Tax=Saccharomycodes ludwigii TaxID=36035 RepID=UPI001E8332F5|nr:hypothetical protein SCDLUD_002840 [Saccharomycodes ludwigii]KAH3901348.1 hypothetical protein SCDLUD_002840 [Saccharomycodes ludwigii]
MTTEENQATNNQSNTNKTTGEAALSSLTKPLLYSLYDEDITKSEDNEIYETTQDALLSSSPLGTSNSLTSTLLRNNKYNNKSPTDHVEMEVNHSSAGSTTRKDAFNSSTNSPATTPTIFENTNSPNIRRASNSGGSNTSKNNSSNNINNTHGNRTNIKNNNFMFFVKQIFKNLIDLVVLGIAGILYCQLSNHLYDNQNILHFNVITKPLLKVTGLLSSENTVDTRVYLIYALEGILMGILLPTIDLIRDNVTTDRFYYADRISFMSLIKSWNAIMGVAYGIRKIEWNSSLQASSIWCCLNIILWLFFDGSKTMFFTCVCIGVAAANLSVPILNTVDSINEQKASLFLYFVDIYFIGMLCFGRLGRYLKQNQQ